jgi:hypothetical protein
MIRFTVHNSNKLAPTQKKQTIMQAIYSCTESPGGARARTDVQLHAPGHVCFVGKEEEKVESERKWSGIRWVQLLSCSEELGEMLPFRVLLRRMHMRETERRIN